MRNALASVALLALAALLPAGCAQRAPVAVVPAIAPAAFDRPTTLAAAQDALIRGDVVTARARLAALLAHDPADPEAHVLLDGLERAPLDLLGPRSFAYAAKPGDTYVTLSTRFLGTPLKAYALARYNGARVPAALAPGTIVRIPGEAPAPPPRPRARRSRPARGAAIARRVDPAGAVPLRAAALVALKRGDTPRALALLRRAAAIDPDNPLLRRDLARLTARTAS
ncbi:tetratricopeptide repeat protein [Sphingomonas morindae]|uniref:LysM domain-containing protein n=1 Tax=Sphingomonas morindae TaxID=1541170 RepID=A0ABY4XAU8_9SPHN|nr:tetratricopeptide repeat protein [Sphingomonas morindae]USI74064.1 LysM domain-containing protein [Sphingomonas morindae]